MRTLELSARQPIRSGVHIMWALGATSRKNTLLTPIKEPQRIERIERTLLRIERIERIESSPSHVVPCPLATVTGAPIRARLCDMLLK